MPFYVQRYRCPDCGQSFRWPAAQNAPDFCPACGAFVGEEYDPAAAPAAPAVHTKVRSYDSVYRAMEEGSIHRAQLAAEMTGASEAEMSAIKITDMKDRPHEGEHSAIVRPNPVSRLLDSVPSGTVGMVGPNGAAYAQAAHSGPYPHAGAIAARDVNNWHTRMAQAMQKEGQIGRG